MRKPRGKIARRRSAVDWGALDRDDRADLQRALEVARADSVHAEKAFEEKSRECESLIEALKNNSVRIGELTMKVDRLERDVIAAHRRADERAYSAEKYLLANDALAARLAELERYRAAAIKAQTLGDPWDARNGA